MYFLTGDYDEASRSYTQALQCIEKAESGDYYLARVGKGRIEETKEEKDNRRSFLLTKRGECAQRRGEDVEQAEKDYLAAIKLNKHCTTAYLRYVESCI